MTTTSDHDQHAPATAARTRITFERRVGGKTGYIRTEVRAVVATNDRRLYQYLCHDHRSIEGRWDPAAAELNGRVEFDNFQVANAALRAATEGR